MPELHPIALRVSVVILYTIMFAASLVGNTFVLLIVSKKPYTRKTTNILFVNLAVADLIIALVFMPDSVAFYFRNTKWLEDVGGDILCRFVRFFPVLALAASIFTIAAMILDRFIVVVCIRQSTKKCCAPMTCTILIWLSSTVLTFHRLLTYSTSSGFCKYDWSLIRIDDMTGWIISNIMYIVLLFFLPLILMVVLSSIMCTKLSHHKRPGVVDMENMQSRRNRNRKVFKLLISIVVAFTLCWFPVAAIHLVWALGMTPPPYVMFLCFWCGHSHSAINPWIYIYLNTQFHRAFLEIIGTSQQTEPVLPELKTQNIRPLSARDRNLPVASCETDL